MLHKKLLGMTPSQGFQVWLGECDFRYGLPVATHHGCSAPPTIHTATGSPDGDAVPPPQLARDAPVLDVLQPEVVHLSWQGSRASTTVRQQHVRW